MLILIIGILVIGTGILLGRYQDYRDLQARLERYESRRRRKRKR